MSDTCVHLGLDPAVLALADAFRGWPETAALALMAKERSDVTFVQQSMYYPVTDAAMNTASYEQFATGYYLTRKGMEWFWDAYTSDPAQRAEITASPNQASTEQVAGLPPTYLCVDEADVLRDEGEAYAAKLRSAGVPVTTVRYDGTIHDFMLLNSLSETSATRAAIDQATAFLRARLRTRLRQPQTIRSMREGTLMNVRPNIVLVHGAWADGSSWSAVIEHLQADGYKVTAPQFPESSLAADVARLREVLARQDGPTVAVGHSYGGQMITALGTTRQTWLVWSTWRGSGLTKASRSERSWRRDRMALPWRISTSTRRASPGSPRTTSSTTLPPMLIRSRPGSCTRCSSRCTGAP